MTDFSDLTVPRDQITDDTEDAEVVIRWHGYVWRVRGVPFQAEALVERDVIEVDSADGFVHLQPGETRRTFVLRMDRVVVDVENAPKLIP